MAPSLRSESSVTTMISVSPDEARQITQAGRLAAFVVRASYDDLSEAARCHLKIRILDSLGCAIGALEGEPIRSLRAQIEDFGGNAEERRVGKSGWRGVL